VSIAEKSIYPVNLSNGAYIEEFPHLADSQAFKLSIFFFIAAENCSYSFFALSISCCCSFKDLLFKSIFNVLSVYVLFHFVVEV
jgi:hypothetical protein